MRNATEAEGPDGKQIYLDHNHAISVVGSCIVTYSKLPPDGRYFAAWEKAAALFLEKHAGPMSVLTILDSGSPIPDEPARRMIRTNMLRYASSIARFVYVVEGTGFAAAAMRSAISLVSLAARTPYRQKVFATVEEAGAWLAESAHPPRPGLDASVLISVAHGMRERVNFPARTG